MDCRKTESMLSAYHDGELSAADRAQVDAHLRACPGCAGLLESLARIDAAAEVPDPGPEYWERFNRRVEERFGRKDGRLKATVVPHPKRGWMRRQLRYLLPAAAAAAMVALMVRHIGLNPDLPTPPAPEFAAKLKVEEPSATQKAVPAPPAAAPTPSSRVTPVRPAAPTAEEANRVPRPPSLRPPSVADERFATDTPHPAAQSATATAPDSPEPPGSAGAGFGRDTTDSGAPPPSAASGDAAAPGPTAGAASGPASGPATGSARVLAMKKAPEEFRSPKKEAAGTVVSRTPAGERSKSDAKSEAASAYRLSAPPCEEARSLAARGRFREAEAAQRACLAGDPSAPAQERGLVFLAELLDRQRRFADADSVIEEAQTRFPRSRSLDLYRQQRSQVQSGRIPISPDR